MREVLWLLSCVGVVVNNDTFSIGAIVEVSIVLVWVYWIDISQAGDLGDWSILERDLVGHSRGRDGTKVCGIEEYLFVFVISYEGSL